MKRLWIAGGVAAVLIGMGFVMPAVAQWRDVGAMTALSIVLLALGVMLTLGGVGSVFHAVRMQRA